MSNIEINYHKYIIENENSINQSQNENLEEFYFPKKIAQHIWNQSLEN